MAFEQARQQRRDVQVAELHRRADAQAAHRLDRLRADLGVGLVDGGQDVAAVRVVAPAGLGRRHAARRARQQADAERALERRHMLAHHRRRQPERTRGGGKAGEVDDLDEGFHAGKAIHGPGLNTVG
jgi:hypothetical protein